MNHFLIGLVFLVLMTINLTKASKVTPQKCEAYFNPFSKKYIPSFDCPMYCCGTCENKFCCSDINSRVRQQKSCRAKCVEYKNETSLIPEQDCYSKDQFCCGSCTERYCCQKSKHYLDQNSCSKKPKPSTNSGSALFWISASMPLLVIIFVYVFILFHPLVKKLVRRSNRVPRNLTYSNRSGASQNNDLPPPYSSELATISGSLVNPPSYFSLKENFRVAK